MWLNGEERPTKSLVTCSVFRGHCHEVQVRKGGILIGEWKSCVLKQSWSRYGTATFTLVPVLQCGTKRSLSLSSLQRTSLVRWKMLIYVSRFSLTFIVGLTLGMFYPVKMCSSMSIKRLIFRLILVFSKSKGETESESRDIQFAFFF